MKLVTKDLRPLGNGFIVVVAGLVLVSGRLEAGTAMSQMADPSGYSKLFQAKDGAGNYFWSDTDAFPSATTVRRVKAVSGGLPSWRRPMDKR